MPEQRVVGKVGDVAFIAVFFQQLSEGVADEVGAAIQATFGGVAESDAAAVKLEPKQSILGLWCMECTLPVSPSWQYDPAAMQNQAMTPFFGRDEKGRAAHLKGSDPMSLS